MKALALAALTGLAAAGSADALTINTIPDTTPVGVGYWGSAPDNRDTYGQSFTLTEALALNSISFLMDDKRNVGDYQVVVVGWSGTQATGTPLYTFTGTTPARVRPARSTSSRKSPSTPARWRWRRAIMPS